MNFLVSYKCKSLFLLSGTAVSPGRTIVQCSKGGNNQQSIERMDVASRKKTIERK